MTSQSIFLDSNLLLLLVIGTMDRQLIGRFKRTSHFSPSDFDALSQLFFQAHIVITTPHILTEVSNLANSLRDHQRDVFAATFKAVIDQLEERFTSAVTLASDARFRFGIADVAVLREARSTLVLTEDGRFASQINASGGMALNLKTAVDLGEESL